MRNTTYLQLLRYRPCNKAARLIQIIALLSPIVTMLLCHLAGRHIATTDNYLAALVVICTIAAGGAASVACAFVLADHHGWRFQRDTGMLITCNTWSGASVSVLIVALFSGFFTITVSLATIAATLCAWCRENKVYGH